MSIDARDDACSQAFLARATEESRNLETRMATQSWFSLILTIASDAEGLL